MRVNGRPWLFAPELQMLLGVIVRSEIIDLDPSILEGLIAVLEALQHS